MNKNKTIICRCEEVALEELINTAKKYQCSSRELKLRTRAGMGYCGGRTCRNLIDQVVLKMTENQTPHDVPLVYQPPVRPITFLPIGNEDHEK